MSPFSVGDRVRHLVLRYTGTVEEVGTDGFLTVRHDAKSADGEPVYSFMWTSNAERITEQAQEGK